MTRVHGHARTALQRIGALGAALIVAGAIASCSSVRNFTDASGPKLLGHYAPAQPRASDTLTVITFNIKLAKKIDHAIYELNESAELRDADIVLLQEMDADGTERIAKILGYDFVYYPSVVHSKTEHLYGCAILSKWPIRNERKIMLPHAHPRNGQKRIAVAADVLFGDRSILVYSIHNQMFWPGSQNLRLDQADSLARSIPGDAEYVVVGGDFNTTTGGDLEGIDASFADAGMTRATRGIGGTSKAGPFRFERDHIYVRGLRAVEVGKQSETEASDHYPVWACMVVDANDPHGPARASHEGR